ncbi:MAG: ribosome maturation factor RimP [Actinomycetaceae bacterium]|nr:ribosome maturation factor RimP [Actinomycetaceae bacterium]MDU0971194.1 ribosome maturation factor RimP [Actinomycetaceae bacterium]
MSTPDTEIAAHLAPVVEQTGLFLESVRTIKAGKHSRLEVVVDLPDGPGGVTEEQLTGATRAVSEAVDDLDPIAGAYSLEVTTPGIERPLVTPRHFRRAVGHLAQVAVAGGPTFQGRIAEVSDTDVTVETEAGPQVVPLADVTDAHMVIEW